MTRLLDPRFKYIPSVATDVTRTWQRFGFNPQANELRRAPQLARIWNAADDPSEATGLRDLFLRVAAARMSV